MLFFSLACFLRKCAAYAWMSCKPSQARVCCAATRSTAPVLALGLISKASGSAPCAVRPFRRAGLRIIPRTRCCCASTLKRHGSGFWTRCRKRLRFWRWRPSAATHPRCAACGCTGTRQHCRRCATCFKPKRSSLGHGTFFGTTPRRSKWSLCMVACATVCPSVS